MITALTVPSTPPIAEPSKALAQLSVPPTPQYFNPVPVVVGLVPVVSVHEGRERIGLLTIRRGIEPAVGKLALPGGYLEYEDWKDGCAREIREETGVELSAADITDKVSLGSVQNGMRLLIFAETCTIEAHQLQHFIPNSETEELVVIYEPIDLAYPTHTEQVARFFQTRGTSTARPSGK